MKHKLLSLFVALVATTALLASNTITYTATEKLGNYYLEIGETTFGPAITSHDFSNGTGTIVCSGEITTIGDGAFSGCSSLTTINIPNSVTMIGDMVFYDCSGLTSVTIPNTITYIGMDAFAGCNRLENTYYTGTIAEWCKIKFEYYYVFHEYYSNPLSYSDSFFINDEVINNLVIPYGVNQIGNGAFYGYKGLISVTIPNSVTSIGDGAFEGCTKLTSIAIPMSVTTIGYYAFYGCSSLTSVTIPNSVIVIGSHAFSGCSGLTSITIPNSVTEIGDYAFEGCTGLTSIEIPNSVTTIGKRAFYDCTRLTSVTYENYFTEYNTSNSFPISTKVICSNPITISIIDKKICSITALLSIPEIYKEWYDELGLSDSKSASASHFAVKENGEIKFSDMSINYSKIYYLYAKKGTEYIYKDEIEVSTKTSSISCSSSSTQTTITLSNITADTDESVQTLTKGIYYNGQRYEADENNSVVLRNIAPNKKCTLQVYGCYNGTYYDGDKKYITTKSIDPKITISQVTPTTAYAYGTYTQGDATILGTSLNCKTTSTTLQGDEGFISGLKPNATYTFEYSVNTKEGGMYSITKQVTTQALTLTTLTPKIVSAGTAVVAAETNISDYETNVGFEWRKYDAPSSMPSKSGTAILYNGMMEGKLLNLGTDAYWNVRPYYEAADGTRYYGEWITFDPSDFSYFEPTVHTYALATSPTANKVQVRGYVMTGTDDVTEQGFEYWFKGGQKAPHRAPAATPDSVYRVTASGQVMSAVLEDLAYSSTYTCRAYAIAGGKTYYGEEVQFLTPEDPRPIYTLTVIAGENGSVNTKASGQYREGEQVTLTATPNVGYQFEQWSDGNTENPYILTIMQDTEITATFKQAESGLTNLHNNIRATKYFHNGNLIIERNGIKYTPAGQKVR